MGSAERLHPGRDELERFMSCQLDRCAARAVVRHLLSGCAQCVQVTRHLWLLGDRAPRGPEPPRDHAARRGPLRIVGVKG
jgi:hypothetical protein